MKWIDRIVEVSSVQTSKRCGSSAEKDEYKRVDILAIICEPNCTDLLFSDEFLYPETD